MANPALPPGFALEDDDTPPLPAGFVVEQPGAVAQVQAKASQRKPAANNGQLAQLITGKPAKRAPATYNLTGVPGVSTQVGGFLDALQHHALNPIHGAAQLVEHGLGKLGVISPETVARDDAAMRQREEDYQARTEGNLSSYVGAVPGEVLPWMIGLGELRAAGLLPKITQGGVKGAAKKGGLLAAEGAAMGATQPVLGEGSYGAQKGAQIATGAIAAPAIAAGLRGASAGAGGVRQAARYATPGGREKIANQRVAKMLGSDPATLQALRTQTGVPGYNLTPAQALATPEAVQAERTLRNNGMTAPAFAEVESANNAALRGEVERLAGTDADIAAARAARTAATAPYYQQLTGQRADPAGILAALESLNNSSLGVRPNIKSAAGSLRSEIQSRIGPDGKIDADVLSGLHENAGSHLGPMASAQEKAALGPLRNTIAETLDATVPGYRANLAAYARTSQPLTDMAAGRTLLGAIDSGGRDAGGNQAVSLTQVKTLLSKDDRAKFKMSPQARQQLEALRDVLQKRSVTNNTVAASGPGTAADTLRGFSSSPVGQRSVSGLAGLLGASFGGLDGGLASLLLLEGANAANNAVVRQVGRKASSAPLAADAIEAYQRELARKKGGGGLLTQHGMPAFLLPYIER
jgi:hypothetical protein